MLKTSELKVITRCFTRSCGGSSIGSSVNGNVQQWMANDLFDFTSRWSWTASSGFTCWYFIKNRGLYAPIGIRLRSKGPNFVPISRNTGQYAVSPANHTFLFGLPYLINQLPHSTLLISKRPKTQFVGCLKWTLPWRFDQCWLGRNVIFALLWFMLCHQSSSITFLIPILMNQLFKFKGTYHTKPSLNFLWRSTT